MNLEKIHRTEVSGVTVTKFVGIGGSNEARVGFQITSSHGEPVSIRVDDPIPSEVEVEIPQGESTYFTTGDRSTVYERTVGPEETITPTYTLVGDDPLDAFDPHREPSVKVMPVETPGSFTRSGAESAVVLPSERGPGPVTTDEKSISAEDDEFGMPDDELLISDLTNQSFDGTKTTSGSASEQPSNGGQSEMHTIETEPVTDDETNSMDAADELSSGSDDCASTESSGEETTGSAGGKTTDATEATATDATEATATHATGDSDPDSEERGSSDSERLYSSNRDDDGPAETAFEFFGGRQAERADTSDDVVELLIDSLERGLSDEQRERLRRAIGDAVRPRTSLVVQVRYLQSRFEELAAYIDALEEFIDENGTADELLAEVSDELESVQTDVERIQDEYEEIDTRIEEAETRQGEFRSSVESRHAELESDFTDLEDSLTEDLRRTETELDSRVSMVETSVSEDLDDLEKRVTSLEKTVEERVTSIEETLEERIGTLEDSLACVEENVTTLEHDQRDLSEDVDDLVRFRESMQQAFE